MLLSHYIVLILRFSEACRLEMIPGINNGPNLGPSQQQPTQAGGENQKPNCDFPPFSRVFVVCSRNHKEEDIKLAFQAFGTVEDVWMVKDRMTKENKGICYVKYERASSAALAIESLDGKTVGDEPKPIKVGDVCMPQLLSKFYIKYCTRTLATRSFWLSFKQVFLFLKCFQLPCLYLDFVVVHNSDAAILESSNAYVCFCSPHWA